MSLDHRHPAPPSERRRANRGGFSFVELLFAMAVLSIGMLGIAAAVYTGVDQTRSTLDDSTAAAVARQAAAQLGQLMTDANTPSELAYTPFLRLGEPDPGSVQPDPNAPTPPKLEDIVRPAQLSSLDRRFAWSALFRRVPSSSGADKSPTADVIIAVMRAEPRSEFGPDDIKEPSDPQYAPNLCPVLVGADFSTDPATGQIVAEISPSLMGGSTDVVAPGSFLVLGASSADPSNRTMDGTIVRLGGSEVVGGKTVWTLAPGYDHFTNAPSGSFSAYAFGRGLVDPLDPSKGVTGANQAVAVYCTTVLLK